MDAFDIVFEEFASTSRIPSSEGNLSSEERSATAQALANGDLPAAQNNPLKARLPLTPHKVVPKGGRSANHEELTLPAVPTAQQSASTIGAKVTKAVVSKRRRQASGRKLTNDPVPAGNEVQQSESHGPHGPQTPDALGDDDSAQDLDAIQAAISPVVVNNFESHRSNDTHGSVALGGDQEAQTPNAVHQQLSPLVSEITQLWRMRQRWHRAEKSLILQGKAVCRSWTAGDKEEADKLYGRAAEGEAGDPILAMALMPFQAASARFGEERSAIEKRLRKLAQSSPLWPWVAEVKGFGPLNLAAIIGEAGEIADYRNPSCLWKRMGLAVIGGGRQRRVADAEAALEHGYAPARRCVAYLLGDTLIKSGEACRYRPVYAERKAYELARTDDAAPKSQAHAHNRAARYMVKRVLRNLWSEARRLRGEPEAAEP